jgi:DNA-directed RNA polymerase specialized sigma24 family protein
MSDNRTDSPKVSAWESVIVANMRSKAERMAHGIQGLAHMKWNVDDASNELLIAAVMACRSWAVNSASEPPPGYVMQAIVRKRYRIWEKIRKEYERIKLEAGPYEDHDLGYLPISGGAESESASPLARLEEEHEDNSLKRAVYRLRQKLPPSDFAILQLRTMDYSTREIAEVMDIHKDGDLDHREVSRKLYRIRKKSAEFLKQVGIYTFEDVEQADQRSVFHDDRQPEAHSR